MKVVTIIGATLSLFFVSGCTSTITKSYSTDFKVNPVDEPVLKSERGGQKMKQFFDIKVNSGDETVLKSDGEERQMEQVYEFKAIVTENITLQNGEISSRVVSSPFIGTRLGNYAGTGINDNSPQANGNRFEVEFDDLGSEYLTTLRVTIKRPNVAPVICSQTLIIKKQSNQRVDLTVKTPVEPGNEQGTAGHP